MIKLIWSFWEAWEPKQKRCAANQGSQRWKIEITYSPRDFAQTWSTSLFLTLKINIGPIFGVSADFRALGGISRFSAIPLYKEKLWSYQATKTPHIWPQVNFRKSLRGFRHYLDHWLTFGSDILAWYDHNFSLYRL